MKLNPPETPPIIMLEDGYYLKRLSVTVSVGDHDLDVRYRLERLLEPDHLAFAFLTVSPRQPTAKNEIIYGDVDFALSTVDDYSNIAERSYLAPLGDKYSWSYDSSQSKWIMAKFIEWMEHETKVFLTTSSS